MGKVYIVGVGPGSKEYLTERAKKVIKMADLIVGWALDLLPVKELIKEKEVHLQDANNYGKVIQRVAKKVKRTGENIAVLRIGDPCISSGLNGLLRTFEDFDIEIVPGVSSIQLAAAIARVNIDESSVVSFHDYGDCAEKKKFMLESFMLGKHIIMLPGPDLSNNQAAIYFIVNGVSEDTPVVLCENLTLEDERIFEGKLKDIKDRDSSWLSVMVVKAGRRTL